MASEVTYPEGSQEWLEAEVLPKVARGIVAEVQADTEGWYNACLWLAMKHGLGYGYDGKNVKLWRVIE